MRLGRTGLRTRVVALIVFGLGSAAASGCATTALGDEMKPSPDANGVDADAAKRPKKSAYNWRLPIFRKPTTLEEFNSRDPRNLQVDYGSFEVYQFNSEDPCGWLYRPQGTPSAWKEYWVLRNADPGFIAPGQGWPEGFLSFAYLGQDGFGVGSLVDDAAVFTQICVDRTVSPGEVSMRLHQVQKHP